MNKRYHASYLLPLIFMLSDYIAVVLAESAAAYIRNAIDFWRASIFVISSDALYIYTPLVFIASLMLTHTYRNMQPIVDTIKNIFYGTLYAVAASIVIMFLFHVSDAVSRLYIALLAVLALGFIYIGRYLLLKILKLNRLAYENIIIIGAGKTTEILIRYYTGDLGYRYNIVGLIDDAPKSAKLARDYKVLGGLSDAAKILKKSPVTSVIIAIPGLEKARATELIAEIQPYTRNITFVPDLIGTPLAGAELNVLFAEKITVLRLKNNLARLRNRLIKRAFDLTLTAAGVVAISPVLVVIALLVARENHGKVIFAHRRIGKDGKEFPCYKFQTMVNNAEEKLKEYLERNPAAKREWEENFKLENDPRVTKLGAFLRKTSLDELPQVFNVLKGEMSLVGPRPIVRAEIPKYGAHIREYYQVLPGITGMWQASGRSDVTYSERVAMDTWYVRNWSVWIDLVYLFKTFKAVFCGKGAY